MRWVRIFVGFLVFFAGAVSVSVAYSAEREPHLFVDKKTSKQLLGLVKDGACEPIVRTEIYWYYEREKKPVLAMAIHTSAELYQDVVSIENIRIAVVDADTILVAPCLLSASLLTSQVAVMFVQSDDDLRQFQSAIKRAVDVYRKEMKKHTKQLPLPVPEYKGQKIFDRPR